MNRKETFDATMYPGAYADLQQHGAAYVERKLNRRRAGMVKSKGITPAGLMQQMEALNERVKAIDPRDKLVLSVFGGSAFSSEQKGIDQDAARVLTLAALARDISIDDEILQALIKRYGLDETESLLKILAIA